MFQQERKKESLHITHHQSMHYWIGLSIQSVSRWLPVIWKPQPQWLSMPYLLNCPKLADMVKNRGLAVISKKTTQNFTMVIETNLTLKWRQKKFKFESNVENWSLIGNKQDFNLKFWPIGPISVIGIHFLNALIFLLM